MTTTEPDRDTVRDAVVKAFPNNPEVIHDMVWDHITECWLVNLWGMTIRIETDGYVHS